MEQRIVVSGRELIKIGKLTSTIGIKGSVKITPFFFNPQELLEVLTKYTKNIFLYSDTIFPKKLTISSQRTSKRSLTVDFKEITTLKDAKAVIGKEILIDYETYREYIESSGCVLKYIGYSVVDKTLGHIGEIKSIQRHTQTLFVIDDGIHDHKLMPFVPQFIDAIDDENKCVNTNLPEGLF